MSEVVEFINNWEYAVSFILMAVFMIVLIVGLVVGIGKMIYTAFNPAKEWEDHDRDR